MASNRGAAPDAEQEGDTDVDVFESDVRGEEIVAAPDVTKSKVEMDWLRWFDSGVQAGRGDVMKAIRDILGQGDFVDSLLKSIRKKLGT